MAGMLIGADRNRAVERHLLIDAIARDLVTSAEAIGCNGRAESSGVSLKTSAPPAVEVCAALSTAARTSGAPSIPYRRAG